METKQLVSASSRPSSKLDPEEPRSTRPILDLQRAQRFVETKAREVMKDRMRPSRARRPAVNSTWAVRLGRGKPDSPRWLLRSAPADLAIQPGEAGCRIIGFPEAARPRCYAASTGLLASQRPPCSCLIADHRTIIRWRTATPCARRIGLITIKAPPLPTAPTRYHTAVLAGRLGQWSLPALTFAVLPAWIDPAREQKAEPRNLGEKAVCPL